MVHFVKIVVLVSCISVTLMGVLLLHFADKHKDYARGLHDWGAAFLLIAAAQISFLLDETQTFLSDLTVGLGLILLGLMLAHRGLETFFGKSPRHRPVTLMLFGTSCLVALLWFSVIDEDLDSRIVVFSIYGAIILTDMLLLLAPNRAHGSAVNILMGVVLLMLCICLARLLYAAFGTPLLNSADAFELLFSNVLLLTIPTILAPIVITAFMILTSDALIEKLQNTIRVDQLTGVLSKSALEDEMRREISRSVRYQTALSIMMIDLDDFKAINDAQGHIEGDKVLIRAARSILDSTRATDMVARFGGDEFTVLLTQTDHAQAHLVATRTLERLNKSLPENCSASIGVATLAADTQTTESLFNRADRALYEAKARGKNQIVIAQAQIAMHTMQATKKSANEDHGHPPRLSSGPDSQNVVFKLD
jgi:diguanylate cyclase (GGDEF)-like protein